jgi:hypothetical protein
MRLTSDNGEEKLSELEEITIEKKTKKNCM